MCFEVEGKDALVRLFALLRLFQAFSSPNTKWLVVTDEGHLNRDLRVATRFIKKPT